MKAIDTLYRGCRFRSRLEARWAVFLTSLGCKWEYEKQGFSLESGSYLPDFWLPEWQAWIEVKPDVEPDNDTHVKLCEQLYFETGFASVLLTGNPGSEHIAAFCFDETGGSAGTHWWGSRQSVPFRFPSGDGVSWAFSHTWLCLDSGNDFSSREFDFPAMKLSPDCDKHPRAIDEAYRRALSARFEHGESPDDALICVFTAGRR